MPIPQEVIDVVHSLAQRQGLPEVNGNFMYESVIGEEQDDDDSIESRLMDEIEAGDDYSVNDEKGKENESDVDDEDQSQGEELIENQQDN